MEEMDAFDTAHVTVYFVQGNGSRKRSKRSLKQDAMSPLGEIQMDISSLRQCSKYFEACMSESWTGGKVPREFHLEVQTDLRYYIDCFSRVKFPSKRIESVTDCIELFKVASQIQYDHVLGVCERYLAAVPWRDAEEKQIRAFCDSGQISSNPASDLCKRLQLPLNEEERMQSHFKVIESALKRSLERLSSSPLLSESRRESSLTEFKDGFFEVAKAGCPELTKIALSTVMSEVERIFDGIMQAYQTRNQGVESQSEFDSDSSFDSDSESESISTREKIRNRRLQLPVLVDLYKLLRWGNSDQVVVQLLLKDQDFPTLLHQSKFRFIAGSDEEVSERKRWASMVRTIFKDVLAGRLYLTTSERLDLFRRWIWLLVAKKCQHDTAPSPKFVLKFILTFPQEEQEEIFRSWATVHKPPNQALYDFMAEVHSRWRKHLISKAMTLKCSST